MKYRQITCYFQDQIARALSNNNISIPILKASGPVVKTSWTIILVCDVPLKIFEHILQICTANTSYCTLVTRTAKEDIVKLTDMRKLMYLFKNIEISDNLKKTISNAGTAEVIISTTKKQGAIKS